MISLRFSKYFSALVSLDISTRFYGLKCSIQYLEHLSGECRTVLPSDRDKPYLDSD